MFTNTSCDSLLSADHLYRKIIKLLDIKPLVKEFQSLYSKKGVPAVPIEKGLKGLIIQFMQDFSDRQMETALWDERDKAIKDGLDKLDNSSVKKYSADPQARFACKGKSKFWYGYKRNVAVDMKSGAITKVAMTPANLSDGKALRHVCPDSGMVLIRPLTTA